MPIVVNYSFKRKLLLVYSYTQSKDSFAELAIWRWTGKIKWGRRPDLYQEGIPEIVFKSVNDPSGLKQLTLAAKKALTD